MSKYVLYPKRPRKPQDVSGWKSRAVPNQSMSLQEILRRFVKRESLPAMKEGIYHEGEYDLEKVAKMDMVEQSDILEEVKKDVENKKKRMEKVKKDIETAMQKDPKEDLPKPQEDPPKT